LLGEGWGGAAPHGASPAKKTGFMRQFLLLALVLVIIGFTNLVSKVLPLTTKDVCLMLRSGYSSETIQRELAARHFAETLDAVTEKAIKDAGAAPALIDAIKSGAFQTSVAEAQAAQDQVALQARRNEMELERTRKLDVIYNDSLARKRANAVIPGPPAAAIVVDQMKGDLVSWKNGSMNRVDDAALTNKKLIAIYFSARWCGPCREFTPKLVEFYNRISAQHPEFEIVLFSRDRSPGEMQTYMREEQMPWPAIDFEKLAGKGDLKKFAGDGIPCLVLVDPAGRVISDTYAGEKFLGPQKVLADLEGIFGGTAPMAAKR
jgi:nucleoredoxin